MASSNPRESTEWKFGGDTYREAVQLGCNFQGIAGKQVHVQLLGWNADWLVIDGVRAGFAF